MGVDDTLFLGDYVVSFLRNRDAYLSTFLEDKSKHVELQKDLQEHSNLNQ